MSNTNRITMDIHELAAQVGANEEHIKYLEAENARLIYNFAAQSFSDKQRVVCDYPSTECDGVEFEIRLSDTSVNYLPRFSMSTRWGPMLYLKCYKIKKNGEPSSIGEKCLPAIHLKIKQ